MMASVNPGNPAEWSPFRDRNGVPICEGDLIRSPHFVDRWRRRHWLYHVAVFESPGWYLVPTAWLSPSKVAGGGKAPMTAAMVCDAEVISGYGPGEYLGYKDRPKGAGSDGPAR